MGRRLKGISPSETADDRMPCRPSTKGRYWEIAAGMGQGTIYDDVLRALLATFKEDGESDHQAGKRLRQMIEDGNISPGNRAALQLSL